MLAYVIKRLFWFVPVLILVCMVLFALDQYTLNDQFYRSIVKDKYSENTTESDKELLAKMAEERGWTYPPFYFSIQYPGWSPAIFLEVDPVKRKFIKEIGRYTLDYQTSELITDSYFSLMSVMGEPSPSQPEYVQLRSFYTEVDPKNLWNYCRNILAAQVSDTHIREFVQLVQSVPDPGWKQAIPTFFWHGAPCQFHLFINHYFFSGDQKSSVDGRPIYSKIWPAAGITILINSLALLLLILLGVWFGQYLYRLSEEWKRDLTETLLYVLHALPLFWVATGLLIVGGYTSGVLLTGTPQLRAGEIPSIATFVRPENWVYLILPVLSIVLSLVAVISIQMFRSLSEVGKEKFILAANTRGLGSDYILKKHNRPVAIFSILTIIGNSIPQLISGSIIIEIIFNIPGMGRLLWQSLFSFDWAVVLGVLIIGVVFSIVGQLITDLAYYFFNPAMRSEQ